MRGHTVMLLAFVVLGGCKDLTATPGLPAGTPDPSFYNNKEGAIGMRNGAFQIFEFALHQYVVDAGLLSDELEDPRTGSSVGVPLSNQGVVDALDERLLPEGTSGGNASYHDLQNVRAFANQAIQALATYDTAATDTTAANVLRGELYAVEGYAEVLLADLFCSGVPLSTLDFQQDFTYHASSTTNEVYQNALAKFDTARVLARADAQALNLARVGQGRAWLALGRYDSAAAAVAAVPNEFQYQVTINWPVCDGCEFNTAATVSDLEGHNGLPYRSSGDPRTAVIAVLNSTTGDSLYFPGRYGAALTSMGYTPFTVADGIEARLIQAEAAYRGVTTGTGSWLDQLNALRQTARVQGQTDPVPGVLTDPGAALSGSSADSARVALLFRERAYWLFGTGHRQGDLRRILRQYQQYGYHRQDQVYPTGQYLAPGAGLYGSDVDVPIPTTERNNPLFHGCLHRGA